MKGYTVVSVDPEAETEFSWPRGYNNGVGKFRVVKAGFFDISEDMIEWSSLVVGAKIPLIVEDLMRIKRPSVFTISYNAHEIDRVSLLEARGQDFIEADDGNSYKIRFNGQRITSYEQFVKLISQCPGVTMTEANIGINGNIPFSLFERDPRVLEPNER